MKRVLACVFALVAALTVAAQTRLVLQSQDDKRDEYNVILRKVFSRIYEKDVVLSILVIPSFVPEEAMGILKTSRGYEAFCITPSASTWETEYHRFIKEAGPDGREIPWNPAKNVKHGLPVSYHDIKTRMESRPLPDDLAIKICNLCERKISETLHPSPESKNERYIRTDGVDYDFAMRLNGRGLVTAKAELAEPRTLVWRLSELADKLDDYAKGKASLEAVRSALARVEH